MSYGKDSGGHSKQKSRNGYASIRAIDPLAGGEWDVLLSNEKMDWVAKQGLGQARELAFTVRWALLHPYAVFRGIRDQDRDFVEDNWLAYIAMPARAYDYRTGKEVPAWTDEAFAVYVTDERVVYLWYWTDCDPKDRHLPVGFQQRFAEQLL